MSRLAPLLPLVLLALALPAPPATAAGLRVSSELAGTEAVLRGAAGSWSGTLPVSFTDLPEGEYTLELWGNGRRLGRRDLVLGDRAELSHSQVGDGLLSLAFPGAGQWRQDGPAAAFVPAAGVLGSAGRSLHFRAEAAAHLREADRLAALAESPGELDPAALMLLEGGERDRAWVDRQARNDYLLLALGLHAGQALHAAVPRGSLRFDLVSGQGITTRHRPASPFQAGFLSLVYPGLGQARAGQVGRARLWSWLALATGATLVELQHEVDRRQARVWGQERLFLAGVESAAPEQDDVARELARREGRLDQAREWRDGVLYAGIGLWALNVIDAALAARSRPVDLQLAGPRAARVDLALVGGAPGLVLDWRF